MEDSNLISSSYVHWKKRNQKKKTIIFVLLLLGILAPLIGIYENNKIKEKKFYETQNQLHTKESYRLYLDQYGEDGRFSKQTRDSINAIETREDIELWTILSEQGAYQEYINVTVKRIYIDDAYKKVEENYWDEAKNKQDYNMYLEKYPYGIFSTEAKKLIEQESWENAKKNHNYQSYIDFYPYGEYVSEAKELIEKALWSTESSAWKEATDKNTINVYQKYLGLYPHGVHATQAKKRIIDIEVDDIFKGEHGTLPPMDKTSYSYGARSAISIYNNTSYTLTLRYSGNESKVITIPAQRTQSVSLLNGNYRVTASVTASNVRNYAGTGELTGGNYEVQYYIVTTRY